MKKIILSIDGMTCSACSSGLEKYLNKQEGVIEAAVSLVLSNAMITYDEKILDVSKLEEFVSKAGFKSLGEFKEIKIDEKSKLEMIIFGIMSVIALISIMMCSSNIYKAVTGTEIHSHNGILSFIFAIIFLIYGFDIIKDGYKNLVHYTPNMDTLVSIGVLSSFIYSLYSFYMIQKGHTEHSSGLYFDSCVLIIYFVKLGKMINKFGRNEAKKAIKELVQITPENARLKIGEEEKKVTIDEIQKGDIVICRPGEKIAVDGEIVFGEAHLNEAFITGESKASKKKIGQKVVAGSFNYDGYLEYRAEKIGKESTISEIVRLVVEASNSKPTIAKLVDKVSSSFIKFVMLAATITLLAYLALGFSNAEALMAFVTVLVVACPCSLGLATPFVMVVAESDCLKKGILVKSTAILEEIEKVTTVVFDKTGTLTYGELKIAEIINFSDLEEKKLLQVSGSLESNSSHPISKAFTSYMKDNKIEKIDVKEFKDISGLGIVGFVNDNEVILGNSKILEKYNIENNYKTDELKLSENGNSIVYIVIDRKISGLVGINDIVRDNAKEVVAKLKENNIEPIMLTGDNKETSNKIAKEVGIDNIISNVMPNEKVKVIKDLKLENKYVMMCGDGINDSPALATADIGVSLKSGTEIAMDSADIILTQNDLSSLLRLKEISKRSIKKIKQNLFWAFFYNILMIPLAAGILRPIGIVLNPMLASLAMSLSSATVIINSGILIGGTLFFDEYVAELEEGEKSKE